MAAKMTAAEALAIFAWDISKLISRSGRYDGLIPDDKMTIEDMIEHLPAFFRQLGFDPFAPSATPAPPADPTFKRHTCNGGQGPHFGRLKPAECERCAEREQERKLGIPAREAPAAVKAARRREDDDDRRCRELEDHFKSARHLNPSGPGGCGPVCTFGQW